MKHKFRGRRLDNGNWVHGDLIHCATGKMYIFPSGSYANERDKIGEEGVLRLITFEVDPDTVSY